jgi:hypothetical protein
VRAVVANSTAAEIINPYFMPSSPVFVGLFASEVAFHGGAAIAAARSLR